MAAISRSRRSGAGIAFIVAGAALLLQTILTLAGTSAGIWLLLIGYLALAVGFVILAVGSIANILARIALIVAAAGWFLLALGLLVQLPAGFATIAQLAVAIGGVVGAVVLYTGKEITDRSAVAFIVTNAIYAVIVLAALAQFALGTLGTVLLILFAVGLILTGVLFHRVQRGRR